MTASKVGQGTLVERDGEVARIAALVDAAARASGGLLLFDGPGGIGKTRLLSEAERVAGDRDFTVLRACGRELEGDFPFAVAAELLAPLARWNDAAEREQIVAGAAERALPLLTGAATEVPEGAGAFPLLNALFWLVANAAELRPVALLVDDAHLADGASLRFLTFLAARLGDLPVALFVAARPAIAGTAAHTFMPPLQSDASATVVPVQPLSQGGVGWLAADLGFPGADPEFVRACAEASGGNPLYLRELLAVLLEEDVEPGADAAGRVREIGPTAVARAIDLALRRRGETATALVRAVAVLGEDAELGRAARLAGVDEREAVRAASSLVDGWVLRPSERLEFVHPIVREAIYQDLQPFERAHGHAEAARLMYADGESADRISTQMLASTRLGETWTRAVLREAAAGAVARGEPAFAVRLLRRALAEPGEEGDAELLAELAEAAGVAGDDDAPELFEAALASLGSARRRAEVLLAYGRVLLGQGDYGGARRAFDRGRAELGDADDQLASDLASGEVGAALWDVDGGGAAYVAAARVAEIEEPGNVGERVNLANLAGALVLQGENRDDALALARRAWGDGKLLEQAGPEEPAIFAVTAAFTANDLFRESMAVHEATIAAARDRGLLLAAATSSYGAGNVELLAGNIPESVAASELALDAQRYGWGMYVSAAYWTVVVAYLARGDVDAAERALQIDPEAEERFARGLDYMALHVARGEVALARNEPRRALELFEAGSELLFAIGWKTSVFNSLPGEVRALMALGEQSRAHARALENHGYALAWGQPSVLAAAERAVALTSPDDAEELLRAARARLEGSEARLERMRVLLDLGDVLISRSKQAEARDVLREALDLADRCGAPGLGERAREALRAAGARPRRARTTGAASLTPAELRVAQLAAAGRTNREIAEDLFVTVKAVKWHLGNTYRKLRIESRDELAAALAR